MTARSQSWVVVMPGEVQERLGLPEGEPVCRAHPDSFALFIRAMPAASSGAATAARMADRIGPRDDVQHQKPYQLPSFKPPSGRSATMGETA